MDAGIGRFCWSGGLGLRTAPELSADDFDDDDAAGNGIGHGNADRIFFIADGLDGLIFHLGGGAVVDGTDQVAACDGSAGGESMAAAGVNADIGIAGRALHAILNTFGDDAAKTIVDGLLIGIGGG